ncbi:MAG: DUF2182 domain-containing protein [Paracoccaceae bacterium]
MSEISHSPIAGSARLLRVGLWAVFYALVLAAWVGVARMGATRPGADLGAMPADFWAALCLSAGQADLAALYAMWALMSLAMMLPTFVPALSTFADLGHAGAGGARAMAALVAGYMLVWLGAAAAGALAQAGLSKAGLLSPLGVSLSPWLTAALLFLAGGYQFSRLKQACLTKCRLPLTFFIERWRPGPLAALRMGAQLGALCLGCCWALMALGFVGGTMNLLWMGAATAFMVLEKLPDIGRWLTRPAGWLLIFTGFWALTRALTLV